MNCPYRCVPDLKAEKLPVGKPESRINTSSRSSGLVLAQIFDTIG